MRFFFHADVPRVGTAGLDLPLPRYGQIVAPVLLAVALAAVRAPACVQRGKAVQEAPRLLGQPSTPGLLLLSHGSTLFCQLEQRCAPSLPCVHNKWRRLATWTLTPLLKGFWNSEVARAAGNCQKSPAQRKFTPPNGRSCVASPSASCGPRAFANYQPPESSVLDEFVGAKLRLSALGALTCSSANERSVFPSISAAWVFCEAKYTNSCPCVHPHIPSKKPRSHLRFWLFRPGHTVQEGAAAKGLVLCLLARFPQAATTACRKACCSVLGRASAGVVQPVNSACAARGPPLAPHRNWRATAGLCCALQGPCGWSAGSRRPH